MRKVTLFITMALVAMAGSGCQKPEEENPVIARVNGAEIRRNQLQMIAQRRAMFLQQQGQPVPPALGQQALQLLIQNELLFQEGSRLEIPELGPVVEQKYREFVARFPSEEAFHASLKQANTTPDDVRNNIRRDVIINNLVENKIGGEIAVSDSEMQSYYKKNKKSLEKPETVRARHILIGLPPSPTEEEEKAALEKIADIKKKLKKKEPFEELARVYSDHPTSSNGGDLGTFPRGATDPEFDEAAFAAKVGRLTGPVKTKLGYHLILVESKERSRIPKFKEIKEELRARLKRGKINEATAAFLGDVAARSQIDIVPQQPSW